MSIDSLIDLKPCFIEDYEYVYEELKKTVENNIRSFSKYISTPDYKEFYEKNHETINKGLKKFYNLDLQLPKPLEQY